MEVVGRIDGPGDRPLVLDAPPAAHKKPTFRSFVGVAASHHKYSNRLFFFDTILHAFWPPVIPAEAQLLEIDGGFGTELGDAGEALTLPSMRPRTYN